MEVIFIKKLSEMMASASVASNKGGSGGVVGDVVEQCFEESWVVDVDRRRRKEKHQVNRACLLDVFIKKK